MVGGGGIYYSIFPEIVKSRWINDIHPGLIAFYTALVERPEQFIEECRKIKPMQPREEEAVSLITSNSNSKTYNSRLKEKFDEFKYNENCDQALRYFFINRTVWAGRVNYNPNMKSRMYFSNPQGWNIVKTKRLEQVAQWMKDTKVTCGSYKSCLETEGENVVIYCDPPYVRDTELSLMSKQYEYSFTMEDHLNFAKDAKSCKHKLCISYDDHELVRELYKTSDGFHLHSEEWKYSGTTNKEKTTGKELVITNYPISFEDSLQYRIGT